MPVKTTSLAIDGTQTIGTMLTGKIGLRVPPSQRSYRWKKEHAERLFMDIGDNLLDEYFLGTIVTVSSDVSKETFVFDGQQRISTTMILIAAIRDRFLKLGIEKTALNIERDSLLSPDRKTDQDNLHFILNSEDQVFFHDRVIRRPDDDRRKALRLRTNKRENEKKLLPPSHIRIDAAAKAAAAYIEKHITANLPSEEAADRLHQWLDFINDSLRVIWFKVADERTAFTIFETMNDRGLRLSAADLLKNRLYSIADKRQADVIQKWQSMAGVLEAIEGQEEGVLEYIRCFWVANNGHTRTKELYDKMKAKANNPAQAVDLASQLEQSAQDYAAILLSSHEKWASKGSNIRSKIETIRMLGVTQLRPVLLAALNRFHPKEFNSLLDACVSWSVRSLLGGVSSGSIEDYYSRNAHKITTGEITKTTDIKRDLAKVIPDDKAFRASVAVAHVAKHSLARYYLNAMERSKNGMPNAQFSIPSEDVTLEHILPEKPAKGAWDNFTAIEKKSFLNLLGNEALLLGTVNNPLGNVEYKVKEQALKDSDYLLTNMTAGLTHWGKNEIAARQEVLADLAVKTWPL
jgi:hypothetical protein